MSDAKAISPIITVLLLLVLVTLATAQFQQIFQTLFSERLLAAEDNQLETVRVEGIEGKSLFLNSIGDNTTIDFLKINGEACESNLTLGDGMNSLELDACKSKFKKGQNELLLQTAEGIITKTIYLSVQEVENMAFEVVEISITDTSGWENGSLFQGMRIANGSLISGHEPMLFDPLAYWPLDESVASTGGNITDASGSELSGETRGGVLTDKQGILGSGAYRLNSSSSSYLSFPALEPSTSISSYSFSFWFMLPETWDDGDSGDMMFWELQGTDPDTYFWFDDASGGKFRFRTYQPTHNLHTKTSSWNASQWYHIGATYDGATDEKRIFVNGELQNETTVSGVYLNSEGGNNIGKYQNQWFFDGRVDEVRVYDYALNQSQISGLSLSEGGDRWKSGFTSKIFNRDQPTRWKSAEVAIEDFSASVSLSMTVEVLDNEDVTTDRVSIPLLNGTQEYEFSLQEGSRLRYHINATMDEPTGSWEIGNISLRGEVIK